MRSYRQSCGLAKALDVVGDRWTLLIIRELLIRGACRYTDMRNGLPGIATNLLAERLQELEHAGLIVSKIEPPPVATTLFRLTERGRDLEPSLLTLGHWGAPLLANRSADEDLLPHWLVLPLKLFLVDNAPERPTASIELRMPDESIAVKAGGGTVDVHLGIPESPAAVLTGKPELLLQLLAGRMTMAAATANGVSLQGSAATIRRIIPPSVATKGARASK